MSTTGRERGGYAKGRERRDAILAAANEVFATRGFRGASLATIAKRVGMSEPGLLHHFASKEELLLELLKLRDQHDDERIAEARAAHAHVLDVLLALCRQNEERPGIVRLFTILAAESVDDDHPAHDWFLARYGERRAHPRRPPGRRPARGHRRRRPRPRVGRVADPRDVRRPAAAVAPGPRRGRHGRRCSRISSRGCGRADGRPPASGSRQRTPRADAQRAISTSSPGGDISVCATVQ